MTHTSTADKFGTVADPFAPRHVTAAGGVTTWADPDPTQQRDGHLDGGLPVEVIDETTGWAHVRCSNGYETWLDARQLVPVSDPGAAAAATHRVGAAGAPTRPRPETSDAPDRRLEPALEVVEIIRWGAWSNVRCTNGWETWVEGSQLESLTGSGGSGGPLAIWVPIGGAALVVLGSVLAWFSGAGASVNAWDLPWVSLATRDATDVNIDAGPLLLVVVVVAAALLIGRALPRWAVAVPGLFALVTALLGFWFYFDLPDPGPDLGVGLILTFLGSLVMLASAALPRRAS